MGSFNVVPIFGTQFPYFFPAVLVLFVLLSFCNLYGLLQKMFGEKESFKADASQMMSIDKHRSDTETLGLNR